jgi:hypothetical protein
LLENLLRYGKIVTVSLLVEIFFRVGVEDKKRGKLSGGKLIQIKFVVWPKDARGKDDKSGEVGEVGLSPV